MMQDARKTKQASLLNVTCCFSQVGFLDLDADGLLESGGIRAGIFKVKMNPKSNQ